MSTGDDFRVEINGTVVTDTDAQDAVFKQAGEVLSVVLSKLSKSEKEALQVKRVTV